MKTLLIWIAGGAALVLAVLLVSGVLSFWHDLKAIQARIASQGSQVVDTRCGPIEYATVGTGDPVLVVHGISGGFDQGLALARSYLGQDLQAIAPSRFGYLRTPMPSGATPAMQADAYACLLDTLGIRQVAVFGTSAGVTSSIQFALRHPDRVSALILVSPNAPGTVGQVPPPKPVLSALLHSDFAFWTFYTHFFSVGQSLVGVPPGFALTPEYAAVAQGALGGSMPVSARADGMLFDAYVSNPAINSGYRFDEVRAPTLVVSAVDDPMALHVNARVLAEQIPGARLMAVPDGGHLLLGHVDEVQAELGRFLRRETVQARTTP